MIGPEILLNSELEGLFRGWSFLTDNLRLIVILELKIVIIGL